MNNCVSKCNQIKVNILAAYISSRVLAFLYASFRHSNISMNVGACEPKIGVYIYIIKHDFPDLSLLPNKQINDGYLSN